MWVLCSISVILMTPPQSKITLPKIRRQYIVHVFISFSFHCSVFTCAFNVVIGDLRPAPNIWLNLWNQYLCAILYQPHNRESISHLNFWSAIFLTLFLGEVNNTLFPMPRCPITLHLYFHHYHLHTYKGKRSHHHQEAILLAASYTLPQPFPYGQQIKDFQEALILFVRITFSWLAAQRPTEVKVKLHFKAAASLPHDLDFSFLSCKNNEIRWLQCCDMHFYERNILWKEHC